MAYLGATGSLTSYNLFAYCDNNPLNNVDATGTWTFGFGLSCSIAVLAGFSFGYEIVFDDNFNIGIVYFWGAQAGTPNVSAGFTLSLTNANTVFDLSGTGGYSAGGSFGLGFSAGFDIGYGTSELDNSEVITTTLTIGVGILPAELHTTINSTTKLLDTGTIKANWGFSHNLNRYQFSRMFD